MKYVIFILGVFINLNLALAGESESKAFLAVRNDFCYSAETAFANVRSPVVNKLSFMDGENAIRHFMGKCRSIESFVDMNKELSLVDETCTNNGSGIRPVKPETTTTVFGPNSVLNMQAVDANNGLKDAVSQCHVAVVNSKAMVSLVYHAVQAGCAAPAGGKPVTRAK